MNLTLRIENFTTLDDGGPVSFDVPRLGMQAGRSARMDWVLPDASRHISSHHFDIYFENGSWFLHDRSTNGTFLQGYRHRLDGPHKLSHGDRFQVGQYIIAALSEAQPEIFATRGADSLPPFQVGAVPEEVADSSDPWAVFGDFDPVNPVAPKTGEPRLDFADDFLAFPTPIPPVPEDTPLPAVRPVSPPPERPETSAPAAPALPPEPPQAPAAQVPAAQAPEVPQTAPHPKVSPSEFVAAFCEGAGLPPEMAEGVEAEALARRLGQAMNVSSAGLMEALRDRSAARHFTRGGERTMRGATDNNPLKFLSSPEQAVEALFLRPRAGFMTGTDGFEDALGDLRSHQAALFAAIQPALAELLVDLDPGKLEGEVKGGGVLKGQRKARAWEIYQSRWDEKAAHENGILDEFIKLFAKAYRAADARSGHKKDGSGI